MANSPSLGGAFFPVQDLPTWLSILAWVNPATYAMDLLRQATFHLQGKGPAFLPSLVLFGYRLTTAAELFVISSLSLAALISGALLFHHHE